MKPRTQTLLVGAVPIVALAAAISAPQLTVPYAAQGPGPMFNVLGEVEGATVIDVSGPDADSEQSAGQLDLTTVAVHHNLTLPQVVALWLNSENQIVPLETIFPPGQSEEEVTEKNEAAFTESEANATAAALDRLGLPTETIVAYTMPDSPAAAVLKEGEVIEEVDGAAISEPEDVQRAVLSRAVGDRIEVRLREAEGSRVRTERIELIESPHAPGVPLLGVGMNTQPAGQNKVEYQLSGIGGPSAGLMMSLGVIDKLSPGDLTQGRYIAGTGTINAAGLVGEIGGVTHKIAAARKAGAEMFFVPKLNCAEALGADAGEMLLIQVESLDDAVAAINDPAAAPQCS